MTDDVVLGVAIAADPYVLEQGLPPIEVVPGCQFCAELAAEGLVGIHACAVCGTKVSDHAGADHPPEGCWCGWCGASFCSEHGGGPDAFDWHCPACVAWIATHTLGGITYLDEASYQEALDKMAGAP